MPLIHLPHFVYIDLFSRAMYELSSHTGPEQRIITAAYQRTGTISGLYYTLIVTTIVNFYLCTATTKKLANLSIKRDTAAAFIFFECVHCSKDSFFFEQLWNLVAFSVRLRHCSDIAG